jgi:flagellar biosynthesis protein FlhF
MIIKKYIVDEMKEALTRAKYELGGDAIIITQRVIRPGKWYNPFRKKKLEVTVALEESNEKKEVEIQTKIEKKSVDLIEEIPEKPVVKELVKANLDPFFDGSSEEIKEKLVGFCKLHGKDDLLLNSEEKKEFFNIILKTNSFAEKIELGRINVMVGPTGVGKTTTIAKVAAREHLINKKKVGLITMDTYRIGAVEQLRTYASILGVPFRVVNESHEMLGKIEEIKDCETILIDTLGSSPKDMKKLVEIKKHLNAINKQVNTYLVLSISTDKDTINSILESYKMLHYEAIIITKLDEIATTKNLWHLIENNPVPVQFFCFGQDVPDHIELATADNIFKYFEENFKYDRPSQ